MRSSKSARPAGSSDPDEVREVAIVGTSRRAVLMVMLAAGALTLSGLAVRAQAAPRPAPAFRLPLLSGGTIGLADLKGRPAVLLFWAPW